MSGGTRSYEMARRMVAAGHEVHVVTSTREASNAHKGWMETKETGINVHWFPVQYSNEMNFFARIRAFLHFSLASCRKASSLTGDVIFATSTPLTIAIPAVYAARKKKIPMVFEVRDLWPELPIAIGALKNPLLCMLARKLELWAYKNADAVVALSPGIKSGVIASGYAASNVAVIPNSSDNENFIYNARAAHQFRAERAWLGDSPLLVYTGTIGKINGVGYLVELAKELIQRRSDVRIIIIGSGAEQDYILSAARKSGVYNVNLFLENPVPKYEMPAVLSAATMAAALFIDLPEMRSNSSNKFFDALASGTPLLTNYGGWMHELVTTHSCGLPMWQKPVAEVAKVLDLRIHDDEWLKKASCQSRILAEEYFCRNVLAGNLIEVLQSVVDGNAHFANKYGPGNYD